MDNLFEPPLTADNRAQALATITSAFAHDPVERWLYPNDDQYQMHFPEFAAALGDGAFQQQTAWTSGDGAAIALWLPPGAETDDETVVENLTRTVSPDKHEEMFAVLEQMSAAHPQDPHWYLAWLAVDTTLQANGLGSYLLQQCLHAVDATHLPAYLETPNPRTLNFYRRHGFEVTGRTKTSSCPPMTLMLRTAR